jgi:hypothetical protein
MNMKKTIAAAAAGAMAVSATATAASAATTPVIAPEGTFTYSLVKNFAKEKMGTATVTSERQIAGLQTSNGVSVVAINLVDNTGAGTGSDRANLYIDVNTEANANLNIQSTSDTTLLINRNFILDGDNRDVGASFARDDIRAIRNADDETVYLVLDESSAISRGFNSIQVKYTAELNHKATTKAILSDALTSDPALLNSTAATRQILGIGESDEPEANVTGDDILSAEYAIAYRQVVSFDKYDPQGTVVNAPMLSNTNTSRYGDGVPNIINYLEGFDGTSGASQWYVKDWRHFPAMTDIGGADNVRDLIYLGRATSATIETDPTDPEFYVAGSGINLSAVVEDGKEYYNVMATLNDTVNNYDVKFTFQTAQKPVIDAAAGRDDGDLVVGIYDADNGNAKYTQFGQHLYGYYGNEYGTGLDYYTPFGAEYYYANPAGVNYNLFQGALVINDYYSMQLADTELFSYSASTLSFTYDTVQQNALATYNTWMDYIQSLRLATSTEWYWDSMTVTWTTPVADTAGVGEGLEEDDVTLEEEEVPVEEEEVVVEEPVAPVENPPTGNSAVALAVIPVALAAAAIVAKKRK